MLEGYNFLAAFLVVITTELEGAELCPLESGNRRQDLRCDSCLADWARKRYCQPLLPAVPTTRVLAAIGRRCKKRLLQNVLTDGADEKLVLQGRDEALRAQGITVR